MFQPLNINHEINYSSPIQLTRIPVQQQPQNSKNLNFYVRGTTLRSHGLNIDQIHFNWRNNFQLLEDAHDYIQFLFPIHTEGMNTFAQILYEHEKIEIKRSSEGSNRLCKSFKLMLHFYGFKLDSNGNISRDSNWNDRFVNLELNEHNNLRITRILHCLCIFGMEKWQVAWIVHLLYEMFACGKLRRLWPSMVNFWIPSVTDKRNHNMLVKLVNDLISQESNGINCSQHPVFKKYDKKAIINSFNGRNFGQNFHLNNKRNHDFINQNVNNNNFNKISPDPPRCGSYSSSSSQSLSNPPRNSPFFSTPTRANNFSGYGIPPYSPPAKKTKSSPILNSRRSSAPNQSFSTTNDLFKSFNSNSHIHNNNTHNIHNNNTLLTGKSPLFFNEMPGSNQDLFKKRNFDIRNNVEPHSSYQQKFMESGALENSSIFGDTHFSPLYDSPQMQSHITPQTLSNYYGTSPPNASFGPSSYSYEHDPPNTMKEEIDYSDENTKHRCSNIYLFISFIFNIFIVIKDVIIFVFEFTQSIVSIIIHFCLNFSWFNNYSSGNACYYQSGTYYYQSGTYYYQDEHGYYHNNNQSFFGGLFSISFSEILFECITSQNIAVLVLSLILFYYFYLVGIL